MTKWIMVLSVVLLFNIMPQIVDGQVPPPISSEPLPDEFFEHPTYDGDCQNKPETGNCINYSDGYIWHLDETVDDIGFGNGGSWNGKTIEVAYAGNGCMYVHILGTSYVGHGCNSSETGLDEAAYWRLKAGQLSMKYSGCNPYPTQEEREETLEAYNKSIELNPKDSEGWRSKGVVLSYLGRYEEAIQSTEKAIEIDPTNKNAVWQRDSFIRNYREPSMPTTQQPFDEPLPDEFYEDPSHDGDCMMNKTGNCIQYSDGYIWLLPVKVDGYSDGGSWNGKKIEVANATNGCMYDHISGTSYVGVRCSSYDEPLPDRFHEELSYDPDDCVDRPEGTNCIQYSDGYTRLLNVTVNSFGDGGSWNGEKIEVANATDGCMYDHILGTSYVGRRCSS
jgi:hypothetical protein